MTKRRVGTGAAMAAMAIAAPFILSPYYLSVVSLGLVYAFPVMGLTVFMGTAGQLSFGHGAIFGVGAYVGALLMVRSDVAFPLALVAAAVVAGAVSWVLGLLVLRWVRGLYLAPVTFAFNSIVVTVLINWVGLTGGPTGVPGIPSPSILGVSFAEPLTFYGLAVGLVSVLYGGLYLIVDSSVGDSLRSVAANEDVASSLGVNGFRYKVRALAVSGAAAGIGGCIFASYSNFINPTTFAFDLSTLFVLMVVVGGLGSLPGAIVGAVGISILLEILRPLDEYRIVVAALAVVVLVIYSPTGLGGALRRGFLRARDTARGLRTPRPATDPRTAGRSRREVR